MYGNGLTFNVVVVVSVLRPKTDIERSHRTVVADDIMQHRDWPVRKTAL
jgi:hypothetical protein